MELINIWSAAQSNLFSANTIKMQEDKGKEYVKALQASGEETTKYYTKSIVKTEQQKFLEKLLADSGENFSEVADIACGGGTLSYHLRSIYPNAHFTLSDFNEDGMKLAIELNGETCSYVPGNIYELINLPDNKFDLVCCWQTLSWLDEPEKALNELIRITKPGGKIYASSLFNIHHDVDIFAKLLDHTRPNGELGLAFSYNTYSAKTVAKWLDKKVETFKLHEFIPAIDFTFEGRGIGTFTVNSDKGRMQISGGYLMNWSVLEIKK
jgi:ubiquinone/menaquinone biosynthesis C-methylase UbiE